ncbi:MAG TPA: ABC transporter permease [Candidatus Polarisedimenticolia bacterium]|jgi:peptide/nickel transport system permease protein
MPYLARRLLVAVLLILGVATATFLLIHAAPGDPTDLYTASEMDPDARRAVIAAYGLDRPLAEQYGRWLAGVARGELGWSIAHRRPVASVILERMPRTLLLTVAAFALQLAAGLGIGVLAARRRGSWSDAAASGGALVLYSIPSFWLGALLIMFFALHLGWLPSSGMRDLIAAPSTIWGALIDRARHLVLPVLCLGLGSAASTARFVRSGLLASLAEGYVTAARARGARESSVVLRHALRNAILPVITLAGLSVPFLLSGSVMVENVFSWPGMGTLSVEALFARDYPVALACQLLLAVAVVAGNLAADVGLALADPRLREWARP